MGQLTFVKFRREHYDLYTTWSADEEINRWLGDPTLEWLDHVLTTSHSFTWMIYEHDRPVANLQIDRLEDDPSQAQDTLCNHYTAHQFKPQLHLFLRDYLPIKTCPP